MKNRFRFANPRVFRHRCGRVYHATCERGACAHRVRDCYGTQCRADEGIRCAVRGAVELDYLKPALLDDLLDVTAQIKDVGRSRVALHQDVMRGDEKLVEAEIHLVCVTVDTFKPVAVPDALRNQWKD